MGCCFSEPTTCCGYQCYNDRALMRSTVAVPQLNYKGLVVDCKVVKVYDGDTVHIVFRYHGRLVRRAVRISGIDSPEIKGSSEAEKVAAIASRDYLRALILNRICVFECHGLDKYGRMLGDLYLKPHRRHIFDLKERVNVRQRMLETGHAVSYDGGTKKAFVPKEIV